MADRHAARSGSEALGGGVADARRALIHVVVGHVARIYFDISYGLLAGSVAGRRLLALEAAGGEPVHGYFTIDDLNALITDLDPASGDQLLDLGCGIGGIAIELHRRTGAKILGVDISSTAVAAASARARREGMNTLVRFVTGDLARPPRVGASNAYAIDSLMFVPDLTETLRGIGDALGSGGRLFATLLVFGSAAETQLRQSVAAAGAVVERLDDVTPALAERSLARAAAAISMRCDDTATLRDRLAMRLVRAEEGLIRARITAGRIGRWRIVARFGSAP